ncbi:MAG TPA: LuxR C-terminal-related transcriptional regulator, partial [Lacipirellulaceae bacterium]|nr:LuxR C-terminal-related transcriptional regulator [Lacipirellulaceae bacterium]
AFDFIEKPVNHQLLLGRIQRAIEVDSVQRRHAQLKRTMEDRVNRLTPREREVMTMIVDGHSLKQVSALLGI